MSSTDTLNTLYNVILQRQGGDPEKSYVARRFAKGRAKIAQKVGEEAVEAVIASMAGDRKEVIEESADLIFHWLIMLAEQEIKPGDVMAVLEKRMGQPGLDEKKRRKDD